MNILQIFRFVSPVKSLECGSEAVFCDNSRHTLGWGGAAERCRGPECPAGGRAFSQRSFQTSCGASWPVSLACWPASGRPPRRSSTAPPSARTLELRLYCTIKTTEHTWTESNTHIYLKKKKKLHTRWRCLQSRCRWLIGPPPSSECQTPLSQSAAGRTRQRDESLDNRGKFVLMHPQNEGVYLE